eukprot:SAG31_NODE_4363_length_3311_cov_2.091532_2_plen_89_part_00
MATFQWTLETTITRAYVPVGKNYHTSIIWYIWYGNWYVILPTGMVIYMVIRTSGQEFDSPFAVLRHGHTLSAVTSGDPFRLIVALCCL